MNIRKRRSDRSGRVHTFSPGRIRRWQGREERRRFWAAIAAGTAVKMLKWCRCPAGGRNTMVQEGGGMPPSMFNLSAKPSVVGISRLRSGRRSRSFAFRATPCRRSLAGSGEWHRRLRAAAQRACEAASLAYRATTAQWHTEHAARRPKQAKLAPQRGVKNLCRGTVGWRRRGSERGSCSGPGRVWKSRRHGPRKDRRWANAWAGADRRRLPVDFADDATMRISHEAISSAVRSRSRRGTPRAATCLRTRRVLRMRGRARAGEGKAFIS